MNFQFVGRMSEFLATLQVILKKSPNMTGGELTRPRLEEARYKLRRN